MRRGYFINNIDVVPEEIWRQLKLVSVYKLLFIFLSYPKSVVGYPELTEKTGFPLNRPRE